jgi:MFS family permease
MLVSFCMVVVFVDLAFFGGWAREIPVMLLYAGIGMGAPLISTLIAGWQFRRNPTIPRLMISTGLYMFGLFLAFLISAVLITAIFDPGTRRSLPSVIPQVGLVGSFMALILNAVFQPFMILAAASPFWRERMRRVFRLPEPSPPVGHKPASAVVELNSSSQ